jgi:hypothetical protein
MATTNGRTAEQVRRDIEAERERLASAVGDLRSGMDVNAKLRGKLPAAGAAAFGIGFVVAGGLRATLRLVLQRREEAAKARSGPLSFLSRRA